LIPVIFNIKNMGIEQSLETILGKLTCLEEILQEIRSPQKSQEPSDRCGINEACIILGTPEAPTSKAQVYKLTSEKKLPHAKFGARLVFSRRQLLAWVESHTISPTTEEDEIKGNLIKSAKKHLRNER
jgi:hypothetical protein